MNEFNGLNLNIKDKLQEIWYKYKLYIIISVCVIIGLIIILTIVNSGNKIDTNDLTYKSVETIMKNNAKEYVKSNNINNSLYLSLNELNLKIDKELKCESISGVLKESENYYPYLVCDKYQSEEVKGIIDKNASNKSYGSLKGENPYILTSGEYVEPGYDINSKYTVNVKGSDIENGVNIISYYILENNNYVAELKRIVIADDVKGNTPTIELVGNRTISVPQNSEFKEPGYTANDKTDGDITEKVKVDGNVDTSLPGNYQLSYSVTNSKNKKGMATRTVIVNKTQVTLAISHTINPLEVTGEGVTITLDIKGNDYEKTILPNNTESTSKNPTYVVYKNDNYEFVIYDELNNSEVYEVKITNADVEPPTGTCEALYNNGITTISVNATDLSGISSYEYFSNDVSMKKDSNNKHSFNEYPVNPQVKVIDKSDNYTTFKCSIKDATPLEIHFVNLGRNDGILIRGSGTTIFIDGGLYTVGKKCTEYLKAVGITKIDYIVGSHLDNNHIQAQKWLMNNFQIGAAYYGDDPRTCVRRNTCDPSRADPTTVVKELDKRNIPITVLQLGTDIKIGNLVFDIVGPIELTGGVNINSLNLILKYGNTKFYLSGDGIQDENILAKFDHKMLDVDVLKYPHHGQRRVTTPFINVLTPKIVIVTNNGNAIPDSSKESLKNVGATTYINGKVGPIVLTSDGTNIIVKTNANPADYRR